MSCSRCGIGMADGVPCKDVRCPARVTPTPPDAEAVARLELDRCYEGAVERGGYDVSAYCEARDAYREAVERRVRAERPALPADVQAVVERVGWLADRMYGLPGEPQLLKLTPRLAEQYAGYLRTLLAHLQRQDTP